MGEGPGGIGSGIVGQNEREIGDCGSANFVPRYWDADRLLCVSYGSYFSRGVSRYLARNCDSAALILVRHDRWKNVPDEPRSGAT